MAREAGIQSGGLDSVALLGRILIVILAFLAASLVAAVVITIGVLVREWDDLLAFADLSIAWWMAGFFSLVVSGVGLLPALVVIACAEALRIRSALFTKAGSSPTPDTTREKKPA